MSQTEWVQLNIPDKGIQNNPCCEIKNPLLIDVVLDGVFKYLKVEDLKQCRAVCSLWNSSVLSSSSWKRGVKVRISPVGQNKSSATFSKLVKIGSKSRISEIFSIDYYWIVPELFWSQCGTWIKILRLRHVTFESEHDFRSVVYKACPNMEQLSLYFITIKECECEMDHSECDEPEPMYGELNQMKYLAINLFKGNEETLWMELLSHFPNLQALHLKSRDHSLAEFFNSLSKFRQNFPTKLKLKHVTVEAATDPYPGLFQILKDPGLELQTIITTHCCKAEDLREVLSTHASSLKKLCFRHTYNRTVDAHEIFPLRSAKFGYCGLDGLQVLDIDSKPFPTLAILKFTPNLNMLKLEGMTDDIIENTRVSEMGGVSLKNCKRLKIYPYSISLESLRKLSIWLPNVEELDLSWVTNANFQVICETWPGLVALVLQSGTVDDMGITGLDEEDVRRINENGESSTWRPITVPRANISAFKDLRSLYLCGRDSNGSTNIGLCAAICGVELVPKLEKLTYNEYYCSLHVDSWKRLQSRFQKADGRLMELQDLSDAIWE